VHRFSSLRRLLIPGLVVLATVRCGGGGVTLPEEGLPTAITIMAGDAQTGVVGLRVTDTLIVRVTDARQRPVQNQPVQFKTVAGGLGADLIPDTAVTDADGRARAVWVLGTLAGAQRVEARVIATGPAGLLKATFNATAQAAAADTVLVAKGDDQVGTVGSLLIDSLAVLVTDQFGNPISGTTVAWTIPGGQGSVSSASTTTGTNGRSAVTRRLGTSAGAQTTLATVAGVKGSPITFSHTATAGGAIRLVKLHGDTPVQTAPAGFQLTDSLVVQAQDVNSNGVPGINVVWVITTPSGGSLTATSGTTDAQGRAFTFWTLSTVAGSNTLTANAAGLPQLQFTATGTSAQPSAIQAQSAVSQNGTAGQAVSAVPSVKVTDQNNNPVAGVTVTFRVTQGGGSVSDGATSGVQVSVPTGAGGVATLSGWTLGTVAGSNALTATAAGSGISGNPVSFTATGNPGPAARVVITTEPSATAQSGVTLAVQPAVRLEDVNGNAVAQGGVQVTAQVTGGGATLRGTTTIPTSGAGVASFGGLDLFGPAGSYTLRFSATGLAPDTSVAVTLGAGPAAQLALTAQPSASAVSGTPFAQQPAVQVQDGAGNPVAQAGISVTASIATGAGTLSGTLTASTSAAGLASFTDLTLTGVAGSRTLAFAATGLTGVTSGAVVLGSGTAATLSLTTQPSATALSGSVLAVQPVIQLRDASGNAVAQAGASVTAAVSVGATLGGTAVVATDAQGVATFSGLSLSAAAGTYTLSFSATGLTGVTSNNITLSAGAGTKLTITTQPPATAASGAALVPAPEVQLRDAANNPVNQSGVSITATIASGAGGSLAGAVATTDAFGVATFSGLSISGPVGSYTLGFGGTGLTGVTSSAVALGAGTPAKLRILTSPSATAQSGVPLATQPVLQVDDAAGNPVAQSGVSIAAGIATGGGTLGGTTPLSSDGAGQVAFTDLMITGTVGSRTLAFTATGLTTATSGTIVLSAGAAASLAINAGDNQSATAGSPVAINPQVLVTDASSNPVAGVSVTFAVASGGGSAAAVVLTNAAGLASVTWTLGPTAGTNTLDASASLTGGPATVTFTATGLAGSAGQLAISTQPSASAQSGVAFAQQPAIQLQDQNGNNVTTSGVAVTASSSGALGGNTVAVSANGVATFTNLSLTGLAGSYQVTFTATNLTGVSSTPIGLTAGAATKLVLITQPSASTPSGTAFAQQPVAQVEDAAGNPVASSGRQVTAAINSGPGGTLGAAGRTVTTDANGVATFLTLTLTGPVGTYDLLFSTGGLSSDVSAPFDITAGGATQMTAASTTSQSATVGTAVTAPPTVLVRDGQNNPVAGIAVSFQVTVGGGSLNGTAAVTDAQGLAAVTGWTLGNLAGTNTVTATASGLPTVNFNATGIAGSATDIVLNAGNNQSAAVNIAVATAPSAKVLDALGNPVTGVSVSFAVTGGGGSVTGAAATTNASGIATVGSWTLGTLAGTNTLTATSGALNGSPVSFTSTGTAGAATAIALNAGNGQSAPIGTAVAIAPSVLVTDAFGNPKSGVSVTFAVTGGGGGVTGGSTTSNASGIATAGSWTLGTAVGANALSATSTGLSGSPVSFTATATTGGAATIAVNAGNGQSAVAGTAVATPPSVKVTDLGGNPVSNVGVTFAVTGGGGTVQPVTSILTDAQGLATVTSWTLGTTAGANALSATATGLAGSPVGFTATGTAGTATQLAVTTQPSTSVQNTLVFGIQPVVQLRDVNGNNVSQAGVGVTVTIATGGGTLGGTATANTNGSGQAVFAGLSITGTVGGRTLSFTSLGLASATSGTVTITAGPATTLAKSAGDGQSAPVGTAVAVAPAVLITDVSGNPVNGTSVTFAMTSGGGSVTGASATTNSSGVATVGSWTLGAVAGSNTLSATSGSLAGSPATFTATGTTGAATKLAVTIVAPTTAQNGIAFTTQPAVQLQDALSNPVAQAGVTVTAALFSVTRTLTNPTAVTDAAGLATFSGLAINGLIGVDSLSFTSTGLTTTPRTPLTVTAGTAVKLGVNRQPSTTGQSGIAVAVQPRAQVQDISGNSVSVTGVLVTATIASGPGGATITNPTATTVSTGLATFAGLAISGPPGTYTLQFDATAAGYTAVVSGNIVLSVGPASHLTFTTAPLSTVGSGTPFSPPPVLQLRDAFGNAVPTLGTAVTASIASGTGGSLTNAVATTDAAGAATFTGLTLSGTAGAFTLSFTGTGLTPLVSGTVTLTAGGGSKLAVTTQPAGAVNGVAFTTQPIIQLQDPIGNPVNTSGVAVTASIASGGGSLGGTTTVNTNGSGQAVFTNLSITGTVGGHTLLFAASGYTGVTSNSVTLTAGAATTIAVSAGNGQSATVNTAVAVPPAVLVTDQSGNPVNARSVTFAVATGGGAVVGGSATTNASGIAAVTSWTLGTAAGSNTVTATATGLTGSPVTFTATGTAGSATQIATNTGNGQSATVNTAVATAPSVLVRDVNNNPVNGVTVTWQVTGGSGTVSVGTGGTTNSSGIATVTSWTLGTTAGVSNNTMTATASGVGTPATFTATGTAGTATQIAISAGDGQSATVNTAVATAPSVLVRDAFNNPVNGATVTWLVTGGSGTVSVGTGGTTNASGIATVTSWTLGTAAGVSNNTMTATASGVGTPATFTASANAGAATQIATNTGNAQSATVGTAVATAPSALVRDAFNNPVNNVSVTFAVTGGGGSVTGASATTNTSGIATVGSWTLGTTAGANTLTATASGVGTPATFTATGTAGTATQMALNAGNGQSATAGNTVATPPSVLVRDVNNNPVSGVAITWAVTGGGGSVNAGTGTTNASGIATVTSWTLGTTAGSNTLTATNGALSGSPVTFTATGTAGTATQMALNAGDGQSATAGSTVATPPSVLVRDANNNPVTGVSVTFAVATGGGSATGTAATTNSSGIATVGSWTLGTTAGSNTLTATNGALSGSPVTFTATGTAGTATQMALNAGDGQSATAGSTVATPPSVLVRDANNNPVTGVSVTFAVATGGGSATGTAATTNSSGIATVGSWTLGTSAGSNTLTATNGALSGSPVTFTATGTAGTATQITVSAGNGQSATAGTTVATAPSVLVRDINNNPVNGVTVTWLVTGGSGSVVVGSGGSPTNSSGIATVTSWTLGTGAGVNNNTMTATATGVGTPATFTASGTAGAATQMTLNAGDGQSATAGSTVATPPSVLVRDVNNNPVSGVTVTWLVTGGSGAVVVGSGGTPTNSSGIATVTSWTLGTAAGVSNNTMTATAAGVVTPATFTATGTAGAATQMALNAGDGQSATAGSTVAVAPSVLVRDAFNNPVNNVSVTFAVATGGGSATGTAATTNSSGIATVGSWTLGTTAGSNTLTATNGSLSGSPVTFTATGTAGTATQITISAGDGQSATVNTAVATAPSVLVRDVNNNPVDGVTVTWLVTGGSGAVVVGSGGSPTNSSGIATVTSWTLGTTAGLSNNTMTATASGVATPATFTATGTAGTATQITISAGNGQSATVATAVATAPSVLVRDAFNNPVNGVTVTWLVTGGSGAVVVGSGGSPTNSSGIATVTSWTLGTTSGISNNTMTATASGVGTPATFTATGTAGTATQITISAGNGQSATVATAVATAPSVLVRDAFNNPVNGVTVTWLVTGGSGSVVVGSGGSPTNSSGIATVTSWTLGTAAGVNNNTMTATASGVVTPATFTATGTAGAATQLSFSVQPSNVQAILGVITPAVEVSVLDTHGNLVTGSSASIDIAIANDPNGAGVSTLLGTLTRSASGGIATFDDLAIDLLGSGFTLGVTSSPLTAATSTGFDVVP